MSFMNFCPPKPGSTVITNAISINSIYGSNSSTAVAGLIPRPTYKHTFMTFIETHLEGRIHD